jgi:hypothetical protein
MGQQHSIDAAYHRVFIFRSPFPVTHCLSGHRVGATPGHHKVKE